MWIKHVKMDAASDAAGGAGAAAGTDSGAAAGGAAVAPWYQGFDTETIGYIQNKGLDKKTPAEAAREAIKFHREAEKFVGVPTNELLRIPKDAADEQGWKNVYSRLGKPSDAKEYDFSQIKFSDGRPIDDGFASFMREKAYAFNLSKEAAAGITQEFTKYLDNASTTESVEKQAALANEKTTLAKNWGANLETNKFVAAQAAKALGVDANTIAALENQVGYAKVMDMFLAIGQKIGEDRFVTGDRPAGNGVMTREQAAARLAELKADKAFVAKYMAGDAVAKREMTALHVMIQG